MKKITLKILAFFCAFFTVERFCHKQTHGFRIHKILSNHKVSPDFAIEEPEDMSSIKIALAQPYRFLDSGGEAYAFVSQDDQFVFKVFKQHHMKTTRYRNREKRRLRFFNSCKIAYDHFREQTGLLYIHLNKTSHLCQNITLIDPIGIAHTLDLDNLEFSLQKKASLAYPTLTHLINEGKIDEAKERLCSLLDLVFTRCKEGILDHDPVMKRNFGFIGKTAVEIDLGSFERDDSLKTLIARKRTLFFETMKLRRWIQKKHPQLSSFLEEEIENRLD